MDFIIIVNCTHTHTKRRAIKDLEKKINWAPEPHCLFKAHC